MLKWNIVWEKKLTKPSISDLAQSIMGNCVNIVPTHEFSQTSRWYYQLHRKKKILGSSQNGILSIIKFHKNLSGTAQWLSTDWTTGVRTPTGSLNISCILYSRVHPSHLSNAYRAPFARIKTRPGRNANHSSHLVPRLRIRSYTPFTPAGRYMGQLYITFSLGA